MEVPTNSSTVQQREHGGSVSDLWDRERFGKVNYGGRHQETPPANLKMLGFSFSMPREMVSIELSGKRACHEAKLKTSVAVLAKQQFEATSHAVGGNRSTSSREAPLCFSGEPPCTRGAFRETRTLPAEHLSRCPQIHFNEVLEWWGKKLTTSTTKQRTQQNDVSRTQNINQSKSTNNTRTAIGRLLHTPEPAG